MKKIIFTIALLFAAAGCATVMRTEGNKIEKNSVLNLKPGTTTRQMVLESFGAPSNINNENNEEKLVYVFKEKKIPVYLGGIIENETKKSESVTTLELIIRDNILYSYRFKSAEN
ncbi:MAG: hypothetical protein HY954_12805 [Deltaproteobacteria bacterium]|nr:hypothetical protein [Deltaproteobacteria bacterium]